MGLDNGVVVVYDISKKDDKKSIWIPSVLYENTDWMYVEEKNGISCIRAEVVYWRKWWGVRNEVMRALSNNENEEYHIPLNITDCYVIIEALREFDNEKKWEEEGDSIWEYKDAHIHRQILNDIEALKGIIRLLQDADPRIVEVYFYDSY